jgi:DNA polymerase/3'-5' exonuclease PolX
MSDRPRIPLHQAERLAAELIHLFSEASQRTEPLGSIRRQAPDVGDIELLIIPIMVPASTTLFDEILEERNLAFEQACALRAAGVLQDRLDKNGRPAWGVRYQRAMYCGVGVDLFHVLPPAQEGVIKLIRTGPREFSQKCVTQYAKGGLLPDDMICEDGCLWRLDWAGRRTPVPTPTEESVFELLGMRYVEPHRRVP